MRLDDTPGTIGTGCTSKPMPRRSSTSPLLAWPNRKSSPAITIFVPIGSSVARTNSSGGSSESSSVNSSRSVSSGPIEAISSSLRSRVESSWTP